MHETTIRRALTVVVLVTLALTGCGGGTQQPVEKTPVTLHFGVPFETSDAEPLLVEAIERFQEENPHITVEIMTPVTLPFSPNVESWIESRQLDACLLGPDPMLIAGERPAVLSLEPFIAEAEGFDDEDFLPHLLDLFRWGGQLYAIPADVDVGVLYYNREMFDAQGISYPRAGWDWQDFLSAAQQLTTIAEEGQSQTGHWGFVSHPWSGNVLLFALQHGGTLLDDSLRPTRPILDDPLAAEGIQWYADLGLVYEVMPIVLRDKVDADSRFPVDAFATQEAAMVIGGVSDRGGDILPWDFAWGAVPLPCDQAEATWLAPRGYSIAARTEHPQEAWALVRSLSESAHEVTGLVPARRTIAESNAFRQRVGTELADAALSAFEGDVRVLVWFWGDRFWEWFWRFATQSYWVTYGDITAEEMMDRLQEQRADWSLQAP